MATEATMTLVEEEKSSEAEKLVEPDLYQVLDLPRDASTSEVRKAYREQAAIWQPEKAGNDPQGVAIQLRYRYISAAFQVLTDPARRAHFDATFPNAGQSYTKPSSPRTSSSSPAAGETNPIRGPRPNMLDQVPGLEDQDVEGRPSDEAAENLEVDFEPGVLGISFSKSQAASEGQVLVKTVLAGGQADSKGVRMGMALVSVQDEPYTYQGLHDAIAGNDTFRVVFTKVRKQEQESPKAPTCPSSPSAGSNLTPKLPQRLEPEQPDDDYPAEHCHRTPARQVSHEEPRLLSKGLQQGEQRMTRNHSFPQSKMEQVQKMEQVLSAKAAQNSPEPSEATWNSECSEFVGEAQAQQLTLTIPCQVAALRSRGSSLQLGPPVAIAPHISDAAYDQDTLLYVRDRAFFPPEPEDIFVQPDLDPVDFKASDTDLRALATFWHVGKLWKPDVVSDVAWGRPSRATRKVRLFFTASLTAEATRGGVQSSLHIDLREIAGQDALRAAVLTRMHAMTQSSAVFAAVRVHVDKQAGSNGELKVRLRFGSEGKAADLRASFQRARQQSSIDDHANFGRPLGQRSNDCTSM